MTDPRLERWLDALLETPGLTGIVDRDEARRVHLDGSLAALPVLAGLAGPIVDVGTGGGSPGIPIAVASPDRSVTLLEANGRKATALERFVRDIPNAIVVRGRAEEQPPETYGVAVARALAPPPVAVEWCLPLVVAGGAVILYVGPSADAAATERAGRQVGGGALEEHRGLFVIPKIGPTPDGYPRRSGMARKRPLV